MVQFVWLKDRLRVTVEWKFAWMDFGALFVITIGMLGMLVLYADSLTMNQTLLSVYWSTVGEKDLSILTMCSVRGRKPVYQCVQSVLTVWTTLLIVITSLMLGSFAFPKVRKEPL